jgi:2-keto-4-pentenoate hydratase/2-oxohepta-3-ene-1,7-dioic acid hydratase in catechol pathway
MPVNETLIFQFCPLGPTLVHPSQIANANALQLGTMLNSNTMQSSSTSQLIFPLAKIIAFISQGTTIEAGSVLITGTPPGIGYSREPKVYLKHGDVVKCYLEGVGTLVSNVVYEK